jgi:hypothetical protein
VLAFVRACCQPDPPVVEVHRDTRIYPFVIRSARSQGVLKRNASSASRCGNVVDVIVEWAPSLLSEGAGCVRTRISVAPPSSLARHSPINPLPSKRIDTALSLVHAFSMDTDACTVLPRVGL